MRSKMSHENQLACLAVVNLTAEGLKRAVSLIEPVLNPALTVVQIAIGVATLVWILRRVKGVNLDNRMKELKLRKPRAKKPLRK